MRPGFQYSFIAARADIVAGTTVAIIQIPQAMAFALIAGLPAIYGLYASLAGCIASLWGSSRLLSTGPVAMVSLLTLTSLSSLAPIGSPEYIRLASLLALLTGLIYVLFGFFRLGQMIHIVPHSVVAGFSSAAAFLIVISQIPVVTGISIPQTESALSYMYAIVGSLSTTSILSLIVAGIAAILLASMRTLPRTFPSAIIVLSLSIIAVYIFKLNTHGVSIIGTVPTGLPHFTLPPFDANMLAELLPKAAVLALVAFVSTHANTSTLARRNREPTNTDQELVGQGFANIAAGFFQGYPIAGSFTRSAVNSEAGARTGFSALISSLMIVIVILFLTPIFYFLPHAALGAIVIFAAIPLIDIARIKSMYAINRSDGIVAIFTFALVFIVKPEDALLTGMIVALALFIHRTVWGAHITEVGIDLERKVLLAGSRDTDVRFFPGIVLVRLSSSLYYANSAHVLSEVESIVRAHEERLHHKARDLVLDMSGVNFMDISGMEILDEYIYAFEKRGIRVSMIYVRPQVYKILKNTDYFEHRAIFFNITEMRSALKLL
jgi:sulfate permease, SulP family